MGLSIDKYRFNPKPGEIWVHFKGKEYEIICVAEHTESNELMVVYKNKKGLWVRPLDMFMSKVDKNKYPDVKQKYRFVLKES